MSNEITSGLVGSFNPFAIGSDILGGTGQSGNAGGYAATFGRTNANEFARFLNRMTGYGATGSYSNFYYDERALDGSDPSYKALDRNPNIDFYLTEGNPWEDSETDSILKTNRQVVEQLNKSAGRQRAFLRGNNDGTSYTQKDEFQQHAKLFYGRLRDGREVTRIDTATMGTKDGFVGGMGLGRSDYYYQTTNPEIAAEARNFFSRLRDGQRAESGEYILTDKKDINQQLIQDIKSSTGKVFIHSASLDRSNEALLGALIEARDEGRDVTVLSSKSGESIEVLQELASHDITVGKAKYIPGTNLPKALGNFPIVKNLLQGQSEHYNVALIESESGEFTTFLGSARFTNVDAPTLEATIRLPDEMDKGSRLANYLMEDISSRYKLIEAEPSKTKEHMRSKGALRLHKLDRYLFMESTEKYSPYTRFQAPRVGRQQYNEPITPYYSIDLPDEYFEQNRKGLLPHVATFEMLYLDRTPDEDLDYGDYLAVRELDKQISSPGLGEGINRVLGFEFYKKDMGILGSAFSSLGRGLDYIFGYDEMKEEQRLANLDPYLSSIEFLTTVGKETEIGQGQFQSISNILYESAVGVSVAMGSYIGINLPIQHFRAKLEEGFIQSLLGPVPDGAGARALREVRKGMLGNTLGEIVSLSTESLTTGEGKVVRPTSHQQVAKALEQNLNALGKLRRSIMSDLPDGVSLADLTKEEREGLILKTAQKMGAFKDKGGNQTLKRLIPTVLRMDPDDIAASDDIFMTIQDDQVSGLGLMTKMRKFDSQRFDNVGMNILQSINPYKYGSKLYEVYQASLEEYSRVLSEAPALELSIRSGSEGASKTYVQMKNMGTDRVLKIASSLDRIGSLLPLNLAYWMPGARDALNLPEFDPKKNMVWSDIFSIEEATKNVEQVIRGATTTFGLEWQSMPETSRFKGNMVAKRFMELGKTLINIPKQTFKSARDAYQMFQKQRELNRARAALEKTMSSTLKMAAPSDVDIDNLIEKARAGGNMDQVLDTYFKRKGAVFQGASDLIGSVLSNTNPDYVAYLQAKEAFDRSSSRYLGSRSLDQVVSLKSPLEEAPSDDLKLDTKYWKKSGDDLKRVQGFKKGLKLVGAVMLTDAVLDFSFMKGGANIITQLRARKALTDEDGDFKAAFELQGTAPAWLSIGMAATFGSVAGYMFPEFQSAPSTMAAPAYSNPETDAALIKREIRNQVDPKSQVIRVARDTRDSFQASVKSYNAIINNSKLYGSVKQLKFSKGKAWGGALLGLAAARGLSMLAAQMGGMFFGDPKDKFKLDATGSVMSSYFAAAASEGADNALTRGDLAIAQSLDQLAYSSMKNVELENRKYSVAHQLTLPFFQLAALSRYHEQERKITLGVGFQLAPVLGLGMSPTLPFAIRLGQRSQTTEEALEAQEATGIDKVSLIGRDLIGVLTMESALAYEGDSQAEKAFEFMGATALGAGVVDSMRRGYRSRNLARFKPIRQEVQSLKLFTQSMPAKAIKALAFDSVANLSTLPLHFASGTLKAIPHKRMLGTAALVTAGLMGAGSLIGQIEDPILQSMAAAGTIIGGTALSNAISTRPTLKAKMGRLGRKALPYYLAMTAARMISEPGSDYEGYEVKDKRESLSATIGIGSALGYGLSSSGVFATNEELKQEYLRRLQVKGDLAFKDDVTKLMKGRGQQDLTEEVLKYAHDNYISKVKAGPRKFRGMSDDELMRTIAPTFFDDTADALAQSKAVGDKVPKAYKPMAGSGFSRLRGRLTGAAKVWVGLNLAAGMVSDLAPSGVREFLYRVPILGDSVKVLTGVDSSAPFPKDTQPSLGRFLQRIIKPFDIFGLGTYRDKSDPFLETLGGFGLSFKSEQIGEYFQLASEASDISLSTVNLAQSVLSDVDVVQNLVRARGATPEQVYRSWRGRAPRQNKMQVGGLNSHEFSAASTGIKLALSRREFQSDWMARQRVEELAMDMYLDLATTGQIQPTRRREGGGPIRLGQTWNPLFALGRARWSLGKGGKLIDPDEKVVDETSMKPSKDSVSIYTIENAINDTVYHDRIAFKAGSLISDMFSSIGDGNIIASALGNVLNIGALGLMAFGTARIATGIASLGRRKEAIEMLEEAYTMTSKPAGSKSRYIFDVIRHKDEPVLVQLDLATKGKTGQVLSKMSYLKQTAGMSAQEVVSSVSTAHKKLNEVVEDFTSTFLRNEAHSLSKQMTENIDKVDKGVSGEQVQDLKQRARRQLKPKIKSILKSKLGSSELNIGSILFDVENMSDDAVEKFVDNLLDSKEGQAGYIDEIVDDLVSTGRAHATDGLLQQKAPITRLQSQMLKGAEGAYKAMATRVMLPQGTPATELDRESKVRADAERKVYQTQERQRNEVISKRARESADDYFVKPWSQGMLAETGSFIKGSSELLGSWVSKVVPVYEAVESISLGLDQSQDRFMRTSGFKTAIRSTVNTGITLGSMALLGLAGLTGIPLIAGGLVLSAGLMFGKAKVPGLMELEEKLYSDIAEFLVDPSNFLDNKFGSLGKMVGHGIEALAYPIAKPLSWAAQPINWLTSQITGPFLAERQAKQHGMLGEMLDALLLPGTAYVHDYGRKMTRRMYVMEEARRAQRTDMISPRGSLVHASYMDRASSKQEEMNEELYFQSYAPGGRTLQSFRGGAYRMSNLMRLALSRRQASTDHFITGRMVQRMLRPSEPVSPFALAGLGLAAAGSRAIAKSGLATRFMRGSDYILGRFSGRLANTVFGPKYEAERRATGLLSEFEEYISYNLKDTQTPEVVYGGPDTTETYFDTKSNKVILSQRDAENLASQRARPVGRDAYGRTRFRLAHEMVHQNYDIFKSDKVGAAPKQAKAAAIESVLRVQEDVEARGGSMSSKQAAALYREELIANIEGEKLSGHSISGYKQETYKSLEREYRELIKKTASISEDVDFPRRYSTEAPRLASVDTLAIAPDKPPRFYVTRLRKQIGEGLKRTQQVPGIDLRLGFGDVKRYGKDLLSAYHKGNLGDLTNLADAGFTAYDLYDSAMIYEENKYKYDRLGRYDNASRPWLEKHITKLRYQEASVKAGIVATVIGSTLIRNPILGTIAGMFGTPRLARFGLSARVDQDIETIYADQEVYDYQMSSSVLLRGSRRFEITEAAVSGMYQSINSTKFMKGVNKTLAEGWKYATDMFATDKGKAVLGLGALSGFTALRMLDTAKLKREWEEMPENVKASYGYDFENFRRANENKVLVAGQVVSGTGVGIGAATKLPDAYKYIKSMLPAQFKKNVKDTIGKVRANISKVKKLTRVHSKILSRKISRKTSQFMNAVMDSDFIKGSQKLARNTYLVGKSLVTGIGRGLLNKTKGAVNVAGDVLGYLLDGTIDALRPGTSKINLFGFNADGVLTKGGEKLKQLGRGVKSFLKDSYKVSQRVIRGITKPRGVLAKAGNFLDSRVYRPVAGAVKSVLTSKGFNALKAKAAAKLHSSLDGLRAFGKRMETGLMNKVIKPITAKLGPMGRKLDNFFIRRGLVAGTIDIASAGIDIGLFAYGTAGIARLDEESSEREFVDAYKTMGRARGSLVGEIFGRLGFGDLGGFVSSLIYGDMSDKRAEELAKRRYEEKASTLQMLTEDVLLPTAIEGGTAVIAGRAVGQARSAAMSRYANYLRANRARNLTGFNRFAKSIQVYTDKGARAQKWRQLARRGVTKVRQKAFADDVAKLSDHMKGLENVTPKPPTGGGNAMDDFQRAATSGGQQEELMRRLKNQRVAEGKRVDRIGRAASRAQSAADWYDSFDGSNTNLLKSAYQKVAARGSRLMASGARLFGRAQATASNLLSKIPGAVAAARLGQRGMRLLGRVAAVLPTLIGTGEAIYGAAQLGQAETEEERIQYQENIGAGGYGAAGSLVGGSVGSIVAPGVGTAVGGLIGEIGGRIYGRTVGKELAAAGLEAGVSGKEMAQTQVLGFAGGALVAGGLALAGIALAGLSLPVLAAAGLVVGAAALGGMAVSTAAGFARAGKWGKAVQSLNPLHWSQKVADRVGSAIGLGLRKAGKAVGEFFFGSSVQAATIPGYSESGSLASTTPKTPTNKPKTPDAVRKAQEQLFYEGYYDKSVTRAQAIDGAWGPLTEEAHRRKAQAGGSYKKEIGITLPKLNLKPPKLEPKQVSDKVDPSQLSKEADELMDSKPMFPGLEERYPIVKEIREHLSYNSFFKPKKRTKVDKSGDTGLTSRRSRLSPGRLRFNTNVFGIFKRYFDEIDYEPGSKVTADMETWGGAYYQTVMTTGVKNLYKAGKLKPGGRTSVAHTDPTTREFYKNIPAGDERNIRKWALGRFLLYNLSAKDLRSAGVELDSKFKDDEVVASFINDPYDTTHSIGDDKKFTAKGANNLRWMYVDVGQKGRRELSLTLTMEGTPFGIFDVYSARDGLNLTKDDKEKLKEKFYEEGPLLEAIADDEAAKNSPYYKAIKDVSKGNILQRGFEKSLRWMGGATGVATQYLKGRRYYDTLKKLPDQLRSVYGVANWIALDYGRSAAAKVQLQQLLGDSFYTDKLKSEDNLRAVYAMAAEAKSVIEIQPAMTEAYTNAMKDLDNMRSRSLKGQLKKLSRQVNTRGRTVHRSITQAYTFHRESSVKVIANALSADIAMHKVATKDKHEKHSLGMDVERHKEFLNKRLDELDINAPIDIRREAIAKAMIDAGLENVTKPEKRLVTTAPYAAKALQALTREVYKRPTTAPYSRKELRGMHGDPSYERPTTKPFGREELEAIHADPTYKRPTAKPLSRAALEAMHADPTYKRSTAKPFSRAELEAMHADPTYKRPTAAPYANAALEALQKDPNGKVIMTATKPYTTAELEAMGRPIASSPKHYKAAEVDEVVKENKKMDVRVGHPVIVTEKVGNACPANGYSLEGLKALRLEQDEMFASSDKAKDKTNKGGMLNVIWKPIRSFLVAVGLYMPAATASELPNLDNNKSHKETLSETQRYLLMNRPELDEEEKEEFRLNRIIKQAEEREEDDNNKLPWWKRVKNFFGFALSWTAQSIKKGAQGLMSFIGSGISTLGRSGRAVGRQMSRGFSALGRVARSVGQAVGRALGGEVEDPHKEERARQQKLANGIREAFGLGAAEGSAVGGVMSAEAMTKAGISAADQRLIAMMIVAEAEIDKKEGMLLVATAIMNRYAVMKTGKYADNTYGLASDAHVRKEIKRLNAKGGMQIEYTGSLVQRILFGKDQFQPVENARLVTAVNNENIKKGYEALYNSFDRPKVVNTLVNAGVSESLAKKLVQTRSFRVNSLSLNVSWFRRVGSFRNHTFGSDDLTAKENVNELVSKYFGSNVQGVQTKPAERGLDVDKLMDTIRNAIDANVQSESGVQAGGYHKTGVYTAQAHLIGGTTPHHVDLKWYDNTSTIEDRVRMMDQMAAGYAADGYVMKFISSWNGDVGIQGVAWNPKASMEEKVKLLKRAQAAHFRPAKEGRDGYDSIDFMIAKPDETPHQVQARREGREMMAPVIEGGKITYATSGDSYARMMTITNSKGQRVMIQGHGDRRKPMPANVTFSAGDRQAASPESLDIVSQLKAYVQKGKIITPALQKLILERSEVNDAETKAWMESELAKYHKSLPPSEQERLRKMQAGELEDPFAKHAAVLGRDLSAIPQAAVSSAGSNAGTGQSGQSYTSGGRAQMGTGERKRLSAANLTRNDSSYDWRGAMFGSRRSQVKIGDNMVVTSGFGERDVRGGSKYHPAIDVASAGKGRLPQTSPFASARVIGVGGSFGMIHLEELNPVTGQPTGRYLMFLHSPTQEVRKGQVIGFGTVVGYEGGKGPSGNNQYGTHSDARLYIKGDKGVTIDGVASGRKPGDNRNWIAPTMEEVKAMHGHGDAPIPYVVKEGNNYVSYEARAGITDGAISSSSAPSSSSTISLPTNYKYLATPRATAGDSWVRQGITGKSEKITRIVFTAGHYDKTSVAKGWTGPEGEKEWNHLMGQTLARMAKQLGIDAVYIPPSTTKNMTLKGVARMLAKHEEQAGTYAFEIHGDRDDHLGRRGVIPGKSKTDRGDIALAKEFGAYSKELTKFNLPQQNVTILETTSIYEVNKQNATQRTEMANEIAARILKSLFPDKFRDGVSVSNGQVSMVNPEEQKYLTEARNAIQRYYETANPAYLENALINADRGSNVNKQNAEFKKLKKKAEELKKDAKKKGKKQASVPDGGKLKSAAALRKEVDNMQQKSVEVAAVVSDPEAIDLEEVTREVDEVVAVTTQGAKAIEQVISKAKEHMAINLENASRAERPPQDTAQKKLPDLDFSANVAQSSSPNTKMSVEVAQPGQFVMDNYELSTNIEPSTEFSIMDTVT